MPRRKKPRQPDKPSKPEESGSRDTSPTITTRIRQSSGALVVQYVMNGSTIWQEALLSKTGQPITCLKDLPEDLARELQAPNLNRFPGLRNISTSSVAGYRENRPEEASHRNASASDGETTTPGSSPPTQPMPHTFTITPLQPCLLPQNRPSNKTLSPPLAPTICETPKPAVSPKLAQIAEEAHVAPALGTARANSIEEKFRRGEMSFREMLRRTMMPNRREDYGREDREDRGRHEHREDDETRRSRGHRDRHSHHRQRADHSHRNSRRRDENREPASRHGHRESHRQERDRRRTISLEPSFDDDWFCFQCGRLRSYEFREKYSLDDGELPKANFCRKCRFNAEEKEVILVFKGLRYYCYGCGIIRSVVYHNQNRPLGSDDVCPPNYCMKCRKISRGFGNGIIQESEVALVTINPHAPGQLDDLPEASNEDGDAPRDVPSNGSHAPNQSFRQMNSIADVVEPQQRVHQERVPANAPAQRSISGGYVQPTVESAVDSEPELRASQRHVDVQMNNEEVQSARPHMNHNDVAHEANGSASAQPAQDQEQHQVTDHNNPDDSPNWQSRDVGTQTDGIVPDSATRGRGSSSSSKSSKSVHWPNDEELSTSREFESSGPSGSSRPTVPRGNFAPGDSGSSRQTGHRYRDPRAVSNGSPPERFDSQPGANSGGPLGWRPGYGGTTAGYPGNRNSGMAYDQHTEIPAGNVSANNFANGYAREDGGLPSASDTLTGMPIPTHLMTPSFYNGSATQTSTACPPMGQSHSQGFNNPAPGRGVSDFSMPIHHDASSGCQGSRAPPWAAHQTAPYEECKTPNLESPMTMNRNDRGPVPVPEVTTTCECDFDALFSDMPEPDMNDEFYSHNPTEEDFAEMAAYARRVINSIHAAHGHLSDDEGDNCGQNESDGNDHTDFQSGENNWVPGTDERYNSNMHSDRSHHGSDRGWRDLSGQNPY